MPPKRILIVGGGASGMSCAASFSNPPLNQNDQITLLECSPDLGLQATSTSIDPTLYSTDFLNDGVQGGSEIFVHTFRLFKQLGFEATKVNLQISFGKGKEGFSELCISKSTCPWI